MDDVILDDLKNGNFLLTAHARVRMNERGAAKADIRECGLTGSVTQQPDGKFKVVGLDTDGDKITIICAYEEETLVVTLW